MKESGPRTKTKRFSIAIALILALAIAIPVLALILDATAANSFQTINGIYVYQQGFGAAGSGNIDAILRVQANNTESGYNTDGTLEFDTKSGTWTHSILLSAVPQVTINGVTYREFALDINESSEPINLTELQLFTAASGSLTGYVAAPPSIGGATTLVYDLDSNEDNTIQLLRFFSGSGETDYAFYIPDSYFSGGANCDFQDVGCTLYVYLI